MEELVLPYLPQILIAVMGSLVAGASIWLIRDAGRIIIKRKPKKPPKEQRDKYAPGRLRDELSPRPEPTKKAKPRPRPKHGYAVSEPNLRPRRLPSSKAVEEAIRHQNPGTPYARIRQERDEGWGFMKIVNLLEASLLPTGIWWRCKACGYRLDDQEVLLGRKHGHDPRATHWHQKHRTRRRRGEYRSVDDIVEDEWPIDRECE